jgi:hypothetical protein
MSEIVSFGSCSFKPVCTDHDADIKSQNSRKIDIQGVGAGVDAGSACTLLLFEIHFLSGDQIKVHRGIIAAVHLEQFTSGKILPLELPDTEQINSCLNALEISRNQSGSISALYTDPCCVLEALGENEKQRPADVELYPEENIRCRVWKTADQSLLQKVQAVLDKKSLILVHGRSLYEGMLHYRDACRNSREDYNGTESFNYAAIALSNMDDFSTEYGMNIGPVISTCRLPQFRDLPLLLGKLGEFFNVNGKEIDLADKLVATAVQEELDNPEEQADLLIYPGGNHIYTLQLRTRQHLQKTQFDEKQLSADSSAILYQRLILNHILEVSSEDLHKNEVFYMPNDIKDACSYAAKSEDCVAFFAPAPSISQVRDIAWDDIQVPGGLIRCNPLFPSGVVDYSLRD